jgi:hypothetical protein
MDPDTPLHKLAVKRIRSGRDLKIIVTAQNSETGVGKTTFAGWLALTWNKQFAGQPWHCNPDNPTEGMATLNPDQYFDIVQKVGTEWPAGTTVIVDDAEELDARRSMQDLNVEFSQRWMLMRLKQAITIITLPSPSAIDSRLEELADVWVNVLRRGRGLIHDLRVEDYGSRNVLTQQEHYIKWPDVSTHPELEKLRQMKEDKMEQWDKDEGAEDDEDDDVELPIQRQVEIAKTIKEQTDATWKTVADADHPLTEELSYSGEYLRQNKKQEATA